MLKMNTVRVVPPTEWARQPVQPSAGSYRGKINRALKAIIIAFVVSLIFAIIGRGIHPTPWLLLWIPMSVFLALCAYAVAVCAVAYRPYKAERRLGYTTWPSGSEIQ